MQRTAAVQSHCTFVPPTSSLPARPTPTRDHRVSGHGIDTLPPPRTRPAVSAIRRIRSVLASHPELARHLPLQSQNASAQEMSG
ncbi:hypothetical protein C8T65DRAFT_659569, partial [Cerioporus squamosus]